VVAAAGAGTAIMKMFSARVCRMDAGAFGEDPDDKKTEGDHALE
jgi:hypothetical protein